MVRYAMVVSIPRFISRSGTDLVYDSFLTDLASRERMDAVSTWGFQVVVEIRRILHYLIKVGRAPPELEGSSWI